MAHILTNAHPLKEIIQKHPFLASKAWRLQNLYTIKDANGVLRKFKPNDAQKKYYNNKHFCDILLKARKLGFSTFISEDHFDDELFIPGITTGVIDYKLDDAMDKLGMHVLSYDHLDNPDIHPDTWRIGAAIKKAIKLQTAGQTIKFSHGSVGKASTSFRGGTPQRLHLSEMGKTAIFQPKKATEIINGAFNSITPGSSIKSESTHEGGKIGAHYNLLQKAIKKIGQPLTMVDMKFHFFPWYEDERYELHDNLPIRPETEEYFDRLSASLGISFSHSKKLWYDRKWEEQGHGMKKEFPSTPGEAFEAASDNAIYGKEMADLRVANRIADFGMEPSSPLLTFWDLGLSDYCSVWLCQYVGRAILVLDWCEHVGKNASAMVDQMTLWERKWGRPIRAHLLPHDAAKRSQDTGRTYLQALKEAGMPGDIIKVPRISDVWLGIGYTRDILPHCWFHKTNCDTPRELNGEEFPSGVACLEGYQRDISATGSTLREMPKHDQFCHSADAFRTLGEAFKRGMIQHLTNDSHSHQKPRALR